MLRVRSLLLACLMVGLPFGIGHAQPAAEHQSPDSSVTRTITLGPGIDQSLKEFGDLVDQHVTLLKSLRQKSGDISMISRVMYLHKEATNEQTDLQQRISQMTPEQIATFARLANRLKNAGAEAAAVDGKKARSSGGRRKS